MHQSIPSANIHPRAILGVLHLLSARVRGFVPSELPKSCSGSDLLSIIKVPSCQLMLHEGIMLNDFTSDYETLIAKANTSTLEVKRLRSICTETYKTASDLNAPYMKELFIPRNSTFALRGSQNLSVPRVNQTTYGLKSIRYQGPKIWNSLPADFHKASYLDDFKNLMKTWNGPTCNCSFCKYWKY